MFKQATVLGTLVGWGFWLSAIPAGDAAETTMNGMNPHTAAQSNQFQRIDQPLGNKIAVTLGGFSLIGLELWWFLWSKPKSLKATTSGGVQEVTVTVDGGYEPNRIVVQAGQLVRLNFDRKDPSSCLEEVRFPDFRIAQFLTLNRITSIEFTPEKPGRYEFACGMNMFRGVVEVQAADSPTPPPLVQTAQPIQPLEDPAVYPPLLK